MRKWKMLLTRDKVTAACRVTDDSDIIKINFLIENIFFVVNHLIIIQPLQVNDA